MRLHPVLLAVAGIVALSSVAEAKVEGPFLSRPVPKPAATKKHAARKAPFPGEREGHAPGHRTVSHAAHRQPLPHHLAGSLRKPDHHPGAPALRPRLVGKASWYGSDRQSFRTASGSRFDKMCLTAAHPTLPLHSTARVTNLSNGRSVTVTVTDRGPHRRDRIIDLSQGAAEQLGMKQQGIAMVRIEPLDRISAR